MIRANEFRIGNLYSQFGNITEVSYNTLSELEKAPEGQLWFKPIPLTEEWLLSFGFKKIIYDSEETGYGTDYYLKCNNDVFMCYSDDFSLALFASEESKKNDLGVLPSWESAKTVHGLQNIYFVLIGEELQISKL